MCRIAHPGHRPLRDVEDRLPPIAPAPVRAADAAASRNVHAAIHDSLSLCKAL